MRHIAATARLRIAAFLGAATLLAAPGGCQGTNDSIEGQVRVTTGGALPSDITVKLELAENVVVGQHHRDYILG